MNFPNSSAPRQKSFGSMAPKQQNKPRWDSLLPLFKISDFPGKNIEFRFVGAPFCHKVHTIYLSLDHARELRRHRNRERQRGDTSQPNIPRDAKAFDVICTDFDYIDEKSYPDSATGLHTCECCGTYGEYVKERLQYFAWCLYKHPETNQWVPEMKVLRFPKTVATGIGDAAALIKGVDGNIIEDIADLDNGGTVYISYNPTAPAATMYRVNRGDSFPLTAEMKEFVNRSMRPLDEIYRANMQDAADVSRSLAHWKYPELLRESVPGASAGFTAVAPAQAPASAPAGFGGSFGGPSSQGMPHIPSASFDAPPSSRPAAPAATIPTFSSDDAVPAFGAGAAPAPAPSFGGVPTFGGPAFDSAPAFGAAPASAPAFGGASPALPTFMDDAAFGAPVPPAGRRTPETSGF